jgi:hypothetical protein
LRTATREEFVQQFEVQKPVLPKSDDDTKDFLEQYNGRLIEVNNVMYVRNPNTPITPAWAELRKKLYKRRIDLINTARDKPIDDPFCHEVVYHESYLADKYTPVSQTMKAFKGMTLSEIKRYHKNVEIICNEYLDACQKFMDEPNIINWRGYTYAYPDIYSALWLSYFWRMYLKEQSSTAAHNEGCSRMIYEAMLSNYQSKMANYELDHHFRRDICTLARKTAKRITKPATVEKVLDHIRDSDCRCMGRLKNLARNYRIQKNEDISNDYPVKAVAEKVVECIEEGTLFVEENVSAELFEFMPEFPALNQYIEEHIKSRMQNSNCHHIKKRGQSMIKQGLMRVCHKLDIPLDELLNSKDLTAVEKYVYEYEKIKALEMEGQ